MKIALVTGGSGFFGEVLVRQLLKRGYAVRILDLNPPADFGSEVEFVQGNICDVEIVRAACKNVDVVHHNVAQVPLAKSKELFWQVNRDGTQILLNAALEARVKKVVYTSSSAVFGVPERNPVTRLTPPAPAEDYGRAKLAAEELCRAANARGLDVSIVRPRTILGPTRMGVVEMLHDWVARGLDVPVLNGGKNVYQFVHADDLAWACISSGERAGWSIFNIGADHYGTMRELLEDLIAHAGTKSRVISLPMDPLVALMRLANRAGLSPLGPYHTLMYGRSMYFDISDAQRELGFKPRYSSSEGLCQGYDWYMENRHLLNARGASHHKSPVRKGLVAALPYILKVIPV